MKKILLSIIGLSLFIPKIAESDFIKISLPENKKIDIFFNAPQEAENLTIDKIIIEEIQVEAEEKDQEITCFSNASLFAIPSIYQENFIKTAKIIGCEKLSSLRNIEVIKDENMPRALAGSYTLKLRDDVFEKVEFENLLIHEFAHIVDLGYIRGNLDAGKSNFLDGSLPIYNNDLSVDFYKISWESSDKIKTDYSDLDFVTGYAMTNPFEDFAESFLFYVKHNKQFKILSENNEKLKKKYEFIQYNIFEGKVFDSGNSFVEIDKRTWDATKIF